MQKFLFDKEIVTNQLSVLNNTLASQRQTKKTLLSYLEKFSNAMYENFNSENTDSLLSLINEAHSIFECIKSNINKTLELKHFLENIYQSDFLNTIDSEKFNKDFNLLLEDISKTNTNYLAFMNNYESFINPSLKDTTSSAQTSNESNVYMEKQESITDEFLNTTSKEKIIEENSNNNSDVISIEENSENDSNVSSTEVNNENNSNISSTEENNSNDSIMISTNEITDNNSNEISINNSIDSIPEEESLFETIEDASKEDITHFSDLQEKSLIINKKLGIAILPYSISDLDELFLDDPEKYSSIQDIIDKEYTVHLKDFENTSISRYREAFKLAKEKSNYTFSQAANFAKKLLVENSITSLIIAACKSVEELDFYIECINGNELEKFNYFKIIEK